MNKSERLLSLDVFPFFLFIMGTAMWFWIILLTFGGDDPFSLEGNFVSRFDISLLGAGHVPVFHGVRFDQTGLLSTLPSIGNVLIGYLAGSLAGGSENKLNAVKKLLVCRVALI